MLLTFELIARDDPRRLKDLYYIIERWGYENQERLC